MIFNFPFLETKGVDIDQECNDNSRQALRLFSYITIVFIVTAFSKIYKCIVLYYSEYNESANYDITIGRESFYENQALEHERNGYLKCLKMKTKNN